MNEGNQSSFWDAVIEMQYSHLAAEYKTETNAKNEMEVRQPKWRHRRIIYIIYCIKSMDI